MRKNPLDSEFMISSFFIAVISKLELSENGEEREKQREEHQFE